MSAIGSIASLVKLATGENPIRASIVQLDDYGSEVAQTEKGFQYYPETITDSKGVNYATKSIPGGSHPIYQFINGTDREISFQAIFTADEDPDNGGLLNTLTQGISISSLIKKVTGGDTVTTKWNVDVASAVAWLQSLIYPDYDGGVTVPPPVLRLYLPNSGILGVAGDTMVRDSVNVILTNIAVTYEAFYRNGTPRIAVVDLSFNETIQVGQAWTYVTRSSIDNVTNWRNGYKVKPEHGKSLGGQAAKSQSAFNNITSGVSKFLK